MRLGITVPPKPSVSTQKLWEAARSRGLDLVALNHQTMPLLISNAGTRPLLPDGAPLPKVVLARRPSDRASMIYLLEALETQGIRCVNSAQAWRRADDKVGSFLHLTAHGIPVPATAYVAPRTDDTGNVVPSLVEALGGPPWVVKVPNMSAGAGVMIAESEAGLRSLLDSFSRLHQPVVVQEFVPLESPSDLRVVVVGGKAVGAMRRSAKGHDFRTNASLGGKTDLEPLTPALADLGEKAAAALSLEIGGIDIMESARGLLVLEANPNVGLQAISKLIPTLYAQIIDYVISLHDGQD